MQKDSRNSYRSGNRKSGGRPVVRSSGSVSPRQVARGRNPYATKAVPQKNPESGPRNTQEGKQRARLTARGKIIVLLMTLVIVFGVVFGVTRLLGVGRPKSHPANVPVKSESLAAESTEEPADGAP